MSRMPVVDDNYRTIDLCVVVAAAAGVVLLIICIIFVRGQKWSRRVDCDQRYRSYWYYRHGRVSLGYFWAPGVIYPPIVYSDNATAIRSETRAVFHSPRQSVIDDRAKDHDTGLNSSSPHSVGVVAMRLSRRVRRVESLSHWDGTPQRRHLPWVHSYWNRSQ